MKNFSFLMGRDGKWQIALAYDLCFSYQPGVTWTNEHQSSVNGKFDDFTKEDLLTFAKIFGIKKANVILEEVIAAVNLWTGIAAGLDIPRGTIAYIKKYLRTDLGSTGCFF